MAADGTIRQVFDDIIEIIYERGLPLNKIGDGRIFRLIADGENNFCELTGVLQAEAHQVLTAGTYDYSLAPKQINFTQATAGNIPVVGDSILGSSSGVTGTVVAVGSYGGTAYWLRYTSTSSLTSNEAFTVPTTARGGTVTASMTNTVVKVDAIKVDGAPLDIRPYIEGSNQPAYYSHHYQTDGIMVARDQVRLTFNPSTTTGTPSTTNGLTWFFRYAPGASYTELTANLSLSSLYFAYLVNYVMWKLCMIHAPQILHLYEKDYLNGVNLHSQLNAPPQITAKPIKVK